MACLPTEARTELEFVQALLARTPSVGECRGPLVQIPMTFDQVKDFDHALHSRTAGDLLWDGFKGGTSNDGISFTLCSAHWMDLASLCAVRSGQYGVPPWYFLAQDLLEYVCTYLAWDAKEIVNMFAWHRERLT